MAIRVYRPPDELDQVEDRAIEDGKREDARYDVQVSLLIRLGESPSREVLGRVGLLEQEHGQQEGKEEREVHYLPDEDPMRLAKNGLLLLRFFIEQTYIQAVEIGGASKLILHGEVTRSRGEEQKYPDSEGLLDPLPVLLVFEYK